MAEDFNELELSVLEWFKSTYANARLTAQIEAARLLKRDWTRVGFFVYLEVSKELPRIGLDDFGGYWPIDGPHIASEDIQYGGDAILWGANGYIDCIEMYAYGEFFSETVNRFELSS